MAKIRQPKRRGVALIEMAIVVLLLMTLTMGIIEYGWMFMKSGYIANAARQGARVGARADGTSAEVITAVQQAMTQGGIPSASYSITINGAPTYNLSSLATGDAVTVQVVTMYTDATNGISLKMPFVPRPATLKATTVMAREGQ